MNSKKVLKKLFFTILAGFTLSAVSAISVDRNEIESAEGKEVVFRNYSGPHSVINTIEQIRAIGAELGNQVKDNPNKIGTIGNSNRYAVIHAIDPTTKEKFDADIFIIGRGATVDHITNLRRIIGAYLVSAYGYSYKDAETIATFVTVYNAVYRKNLDYFQTKYKNIVTEKLSASIVGLSTDYEEWPGKTQIVIPLSDLNGGLSTVDTSLISDKEVIKSMQDEDDKGVDTRKDMVDIKEREADNAQEKADAAQKKADEEKARLAEEQKKKAEADAAAAKAKADADKKKAEADAAKKKADEAKEAAKNNPNDKQAQKDAKDAQKEADNAKKDAENAQKQADDAQKQADEQSQKTDEQSQKADEAQKSADEQQEKADQKRDEAQAERESIAKDQKELLESQRNLEANVMYGLKNVDDAGVTSQIIKMNPQDGTVTKESPVKVIRARTVYEDEKGFIAVAGTNVGNGAVRLVQIDKKNLEIAAESAEKLSEFSVLVEQGGNYFCTLQDGNDCYIAKFNNNVEKLMQSNVKVKAATPITITNAGIMVTDSNGQPIILDPTNLTSISSESKPDNRTLIQRTGDAASNVLDAK
ncbi:MAG: hypothetical protein II821_09150 [Treponema sp.]|nr:hypothetical protein [Treponema sp.]